MESSAYPLLISESDDDDDSSSNNNSNQNDNAPPPPYMPPPHPSRHPHHPPPPSRRPQQRYRPLRTTSAIGLTTSGPPGVGVPGGGNNGPPSNRPPSGTRRGTRGSRGPRASSVGRANSAPYYRKSACHVCVDLFHSMLNSRCRASFSPLGCSRFHLVYDYGFLITIITTITLEIQGRS